MLFEINNITQGSVVSVSYIVNLSKLVHVFFFFSFIKLIWFNWTFDLSVEWKRKLGLATVAGVMFMWN